MGLSDLLAIDAEDRVQAFLRNGKAVPRDKTLSMPQMSLAPVFFIK
jgi:hypothetical protein